MPPKPIIDTKDVLAVALSIVRDNGIENINARSVAKALNCSTKPLFRLYKNMGELKQDLFFQMNKYCSDYLQEYAGFHKDYIGVALRYISFAEEEPNLFKALFMSNTITKTTLATMPMDQDIEGLLNEISKTAEVNKQEAQAIYQKMWLLSHGIASIVATNGGLLETQEVKAVLIDAFRGFVLSVKCGGQNNVISRRC